MKRMSEPTNGNLDFSPVLLLFCVTIPLMNARPTNPFKSVIFAGSASTTLIPAHGTVAIPAHGTVAPPSDEQRNEKNGPNFGSDSQRERRKGPGQVLTCRRQHDRRRRARKRESPHPEKACRAEGVGDQILHSPGPTSASITQPWTLARL